MRNFSQVGLVGETDNNKRVYHDSDMPFFYFSMIKLSVSNQ